MKNIVSNLSFFLVFAVVFSSLTGCSGTTSDENAGNAKPGPKAKSVSSDESTYPPIPAALAQAEFELMDGSKSKISDRKGKLILVNLWGIWCGPCRAEMPHLIELQNKYRDEGFEVIGLNIGDSEAQPEDIAKIIEFGKEMNLNYELARSPRETTDQIYRLAGFDGVPLSLLISREGRLRAVLRGAGANAIAQMKQSIERAMGQ